MTAMNGRSVLVLGAGIVGVAAALELQARGAEVTLIDRGAPGREASYGNAGVISRGSLIPLNNPALRGALPGLMTNRKAALRYSLPYVLRNARWTLGFLANTRNAAFEATATALDGLIRLSAETHRRWMTEAGVLNRLRDTGWLHLYRSQAGFDASRPMRDTLKRFGVATETLDLGGIRALEPALEPIFERGLWIKDSTSVDMPGLVVGAYARLFADRGGRIARDRISDLALTDGLWTARGDGAAWRAERAVIALGAWSRELLERIGMRVPMGIERGYHMHYAPAGGTLTRPIHDTAGGYVMAPMERGLRLTTGVELTDRDAPPNHRQLTQAEAAARQAIALGARVEDTPWLGRRPTLPDSRPVIGPAPERPGLYLAFGHQHIGFATGPGTARVLADLIEGATPEIPAAPFAPSRFLR